MGNPLRITQGRPNKGPPKTDRGRLMARRCYTHPLKMMYKCSNSCECWRADQICTSGCPSDRWCNQYPLPPPSRARPRAGTIARPTNNVGKMMWWPLRPTQYYYRSSSSNTSMCCHLPSQPMMQVGPLHRPVPAAPPCSKRPPILPPPKVLHQYSLVAANKFQSAPDQGTVLVRNPNFLTIATVTSCRRPILAQETPNWITPGCAKTCLRARTKIRTSWKSLNISIRYTNMPEQRSSSFTQPWRSLPSLTRSTL